MKRSKKFYDIQIDANHSSVRTNPRNPIVIYFSGPIGVGKSTLITELSNLLSSTCKVECVLEPIDKWQKSGLFESFCADPKRWAIEFQQYVLVTRVQGEIEMRNCNPNADIYLVERSIFDDYFIFIYTLFENKTISEDQLNAYKSWWGMWARLLPHTPSGFVLLHTNVDELMRRVQERGRRGEDSCVSRAYQQQLVDAHELLFDRIENNPTSAGIQCTPRVLRFDVLHDHRSCDESRAKMHATFVDFFKQIDPTLDI